MKRKALFLLSKKLHTDLFFFQESHSADNDTVFGKPNGVMIFGFLMEGNIQLVPLPRHSSSNNDIKQFMQKYNLTDVWRCKFPN